MSLFLLTGENDFLRQAQLRKYKTGFLKKYPQGQIEQFSAENSVQQIHDSLQAQTLWSGPRLLIITEWWSAENFSEAESQGLLEELQNTESQNVILLIEPSLDGRTKYAKWLEKTAQVERFGPLDRSATLDWMQSQATALGLKISAEILAQLLTHIGQIDWSAVRVNTRTKTIDWAAVERQFGSRGENLWQLYQALKCLTIYKDGAPVEPQDLSELFPPKTHALVWDFLDLLGQRRLSAALESWRALLKKEPSPYELWGLIVAQFGFWLEVHWHDQFSQDVSSWKGHPWRTQKVRQQLQQFSAENLQCIIQDLSTLDERVKTGKIAQSGDQTAGFFLALETFFIRHFAPANKRLW